MDKTLNDRIMDLMDKHEWMPASIARYLIATGIDIEQYL